MCSRSRDERGTGIVGTAFGALVFLAFMTLAAHTLIGLYATSVVTSVAFDDAKQIASNPRDPAQVAASEQDAQHRLRGFKNVQVNVSENADDVAFHVSVQRPNLLPAALAASTGLATIDRTAHVRPEELR